MEKFKNPLQKSSRCTKWEAPVISIQTEQRAFCGRVSPAPRPLPLPQPPWQQKNIWESTPEQSIKPGGRPITCPQQSGPAHSTPPGLHLFINSHLLPLPPEGKCTSYTAPHLHSIQSFLLQSFHFPSYSPSISHPPTHFVLGPRFPAIPTQPANAPPPPATLLCVPQMVASLGRGDEGRSPTGKWLIYLFSMPNTEQETDSFWRCTEQTQASCSHSLFKVMVSCQLFSLQLSQTQHIRTLNKC